MSKKRKNNFKKEVSSKGSFFRADDATLLNRMDNYFKKESEKYKRIKR